MPPAVVHPLLSGELKKQMDLAAFYGAYRADGHGRAAFDPGMVVALLLYAYAPGTRCGDVLGLCAQAGLVQVDVIAVDGTKVHANASERATCDYEQIGPMVDAGRRELCAAGVAEAPQVVLADAGYWHQVQMQALAGDGIQVLIPPDANKRKGTRPGWNGGLYAFMRRVLHTPVGAGLYGKRNGMIEPEAPPAAPAARGRLTRAS